MERIHGVGVDIERFRPNRAIEQEKRKELGIPEDAFHIVSVAELNQNKNQRLIIEALAELQEKNIYFTLCGKGENREFLEKLAEDRGVEHRVKLLGYRTDVEEILQTADCFVFPSIREGFGIAAVEALACGVPVIAADNRGTREYMRDGKNGILCSTMKTEEFVQAIRRLHEEPDFRRALAGACRESAKPYALSAVDTDMRRIYESVRKK